MNLFTHARRWGIAVVALAFTLALSTPTYGHAVDARVHHPKIHRLGYYKHHHECRTAKCVRHANRLWIKNHPPKPSVSFSGSMSALEACIIHNESGGNPQATNGKYEGIGQWEQSTWEADGGTRYASTPLGASYAQQEAVLRGEGEAGMRNQQGQYDHCS